MRKLLIVFIAVAMLGACSNDNAEEFNDFSIDFYTQMFTDGEQSELVNEMYAEYVSEFSNHEDSELYKAIDGMYRGLNNGNATKYQLTAMSLLNEIN